MLIVRIAVTRWLWEWITPVWTWEK